MAEEPKLIIVGGPRSIFMDHLRNQIIMSIGEQDNTNAERFRYSIHEQPITWEDWHESETLYNDFQKRRREFLGEWIKDDSEPTKR